MKDDEMKLLLRSFDDELTAADQMRLKDLLAASAEARERKAEVRRMREIVAGGAAKSFTPGFAERVEARTAPAPARSAEESGDRPTSAERRPTSAERRSVRAERRARPAHRRRFAGGAALAIVALAAVGMVWILTARSTTVPLGEMQTLALSDGSVVELSGGSTISYRWFWGRAVRHVRLDGEAYFDVADSKKPFIVETFNAGVTVLGTRFNVRAWGDEPARETSVAVESGRVAVASRSTWQAASPDASPVVLHAGEATVVVADSSAARPARPAAIDRITTWRFGGLAFADQPLISVFRTIERRFDVDVHTEHAAVERRVVTYLNPNPRSAEEVLSDICHTLDLRFRRTATGYEILPN